MTKEEAIRRIKAWNLDADDMEVLSEVIPELKENEDSEDEKIRKWLYDYISNCPNNNFAFYGGVGKDAVLNYLEKQKERGEANFREGYLHGFEDAQKEQKPVECIKFDNEFENQISHLIASVLNGEYEYNEGFVKYVAQSLLGYARKEQKPINNSTREKIISRATSEKQVVLISESGGEAEIGWDTRSLEDAKKLLEYGLAFINKNITNPAEKQKDSASNSFDDVWDEEDCEEIIAEGQKLTPRFKELLKEVCHAWYDRGVKLAEQKAAETPQWMIDFLNDILSSCIIYDDYVRRREYQSKVLGIIKWLENQKTKTPQWMIDFLKEIQPYSINKEEYAGYAGRIEFESKILTIIKWLEGNFIQQKEQKPAEWSEDDEKMRTKVLEALDAYADHVQYTGFCANSEFIRKELMGWLKSLRPQSKDEIHKEKNEKPKHTEVWVEGRTIFEQDANTFVNTEGKPEAKLTGWVARDKECDPYFRLGLILFKEGKPQRSGNCWNGTIALQLPWESFPDLKWEDEPIEVEITIRKK
jgi:hypothetical protein